MLRRLPSCGAEDPDHRWHACATCRARSNERQAQKRRRAAAPRDRKQRRCGSIAPEHRSQGCRECARAYAANHYTAHERRINRRRAAARQYGDPEKVAIGRARAYIASLVAGGKLAKTCAQCRNAAAHLVLYELGDYADLSRRRGPPNRPPRFAFACKAHRGVIMRDIPEASATPEAVRAGPQTVGDAYALARVHFEALTGQERALVLDYASRTPWGTSLSPESPMYLMRFANAVRRFR